MLTCDEALELISAQMDGALRDEQRTRLDAHLTQCGDCRALLADFQAMHAAFDRADALPPPNLKADVMARVRAEKVVSMPAAKSRWRRRTWGSLVAVLAVVVLGAGGLHLIYSPATGGGASPAGAPPTGLQFAGGAGPVGGLDDAVLENTPAVAAEHPIAQGAGDGAEGTITFVAPKGEPERGAVLTSSPPIAPRGVLNGTAQDGVSDYYGLVALRDATALDLEGYPAEIVDGEVYYTLPTADFQALLIQVEGWDDVTLTLEGDGITADAAYGLVVVLAAP